MDGQISQKFDSCGIKIAWVNSILVTKSINLQLFTLILYVLGVHCYVVILKLTTSTQSIDGEVYDLTYTG